MALYVTALTGYYSVKGRRAARRCLWKAGFIQLTGRNVQRGHWEIWALMIPSMALGPLAGKSEAEIIAWLQDQLPLCCIDQTTTVYDTAQAQITSMRKERHVP